MSTDDTARTPYHTRIGVAEDTRRQLVAVLNQTLADTSDLCSQTKQAHWNVKGKGSYQLHPLYDELAEKLEEPLDLVAERIVLLGGYAFGTVRVAAEPSRTSPFPGADQDGDADAMNDPPFLTTLADRWAEYAVAIRADNKPASDELGDPGTTDLYDQVTHVADRGTWSVEAHLQRYHGGLPQDGQDPE